MLFFQKSVRKENSDLSNLLDTSTKPNASNANDCTDAGSYSFNTSTQNTPASGYYVALVIKRGASDGCMIACDVNNNKLYVRALTSGTWTAWKTIVS